MSESRVSHPVLGAVADLGLLVAAFLALLLVAAAVPALAAPPEAAPAATAAPPVASPAAACGSDAWLLPAPAPRTEGAPAEAASVVPASTVRARYCRCGCGVRCTTDADCGPGGRCVAFLSCC